MQICREGGFCYIKPHCWNAPYWHKICSDFNVCIWYMVASSCICTDTSKAEYRALQTVLTA